MSPLELCFHLHVFITCSPHGLRGAVSVSLHVGAADFSSIPSVRPLLRSCSVI